MDSISELRKSVEKIRETAVTVGAGDGVHMREEFEDLLVEFVRARGAMKEIQKAVKEIEAAVSEQLESRFSEKQTKLVGEKVQITRVYRPSYGVEDGAIDTLPDHLIERKLNTKALSEHMRDYALPEGITMTKKFSHNIIAEVKP